MSEQRKIDVTPWGHRGPHRWVLKRHLEAALAEQDRQDKLIALERSCGSLNRCSGALSASQAVAEATLSGSYTAEHGAVRKAQRAKKKEARRMDSVRAWFGAKVDSDVKS